MEDKKLNEVTTVNSGTLANVKTFLAVMKDGTIQQMSKEDLASVVGGLLQGSLLPSCRSQELNYGDMNNFTTPMICRLNTYGDSQFVKTNWPTIATQGVFSVTVCGDLIIQQVFGLSSKYGYACRIFIGGSWQEWVEAAG